MRGLIAIGGQSFNKWHKVADPEFVNKIGRQLNSNCPIVKKIRYDFLIISYGNELVQKYRKERNKAHIITQLRRLGYLKKQMKVKHLREIFLSTKVSLILKAMEKLAGIKEGGDELEFPTVAQGYRTLIIAVADCLYSIFNKNGNNQGKEEIKDFKFQFMRDYLISMSKIAAESANDHKRNKKKLMPTQDDIRCLSKYLLEKRNTCYEELSNGFSKPKYIALLKVSMTLLQVTNFRRPGDIQNITVKDYENQMSAATADPARYEKPSKEVKDVVDDHVIVNIRGKLDREVRVIISLDQKMSLDLLYQHRDKMNIAKENRHSFALEETEKNKIRYLNAYVLLREAVIECGILKERRATLTATRLRKHIATISMTLNLTDAELAD